MSDYWEFTTYMCIGLAVIGFVMAASFLMFQMRRLGWENTLRNRFIWLIVGTTVCISLNSILTTLALVCVSKSMRDETIHIAVASATIIMASAFHLAALKLRTDAVIIPGFWQQCLQGLHYCIGATSVLFLVSCVYDIYIASPDIAGCQKTRPVTISWATLAVGFFSVVIDIVYVGCFLRYVINTKKLFGNRSVQMTSIIAEEGLRITSLQLLGVLVFGVYLGTENGGGIFLTLAMTCFVIACGFWMRMKYKIDAQIAKQPSEQQLAAARPQETASISISIPDLD